MRDEGRPSEYAERAVGRIGMSISTFSANIAGKVALSLTRSPSAPPKHSREDWNIWFRRRHTASYLA